MVAKSRSGGWWSRSQVPLGKGMKSVCTGEEWHVRITTRITSILPPKTLPAQNTVLSAPLSGSRKCLESFMPSSHMAGFLDSPEDQGCSLSSLLTTAYLPSLLSCTADLKWRFHLLTSDFLLFSHQSIAHRFLLTHFSLSLHLPSLGRAGTASYSLCPSLHGRPWSRILSAVSLPSDPPVRGCLLLQRQPRATVPAFIHSFSASSPTGSFICFLSPLLCENDPGFLVFPFLFPFNLWQFLFICVSNLKNAFVNLPPALSLRGLALPIHPQAITKEAREVSVGIKLSECLLSTLGALKNEAPRMCFHDTKRQVPSEQSSVPLVPEED